jgi:hypothetical protein
MTVTVDTLCRGELDFQGVEPVAPNVGPVVPATTNLLAVDDREIYTDTRQNYFS